MKEAYRNLLEASHMFHKLNFTSILPNITKSEFVALKCIAGYHGNQQVCCEGIQVSKLVEHLQVLPPAASRTIKSLEEKGYAERASSPENRRNVYVKLTPAGRDILQKSEEIMETFAEKVFARTNEEDLRRVCDYLYQLYDAAREEIENLKRS